uniref:Uncharacterized protein n=1 Tax=Oryza rufipogon TaxID=4529 RepID=A0A0E0NAI5_ORYRU
MCAHNAWISRVAEWLAPSSNGTAPSSCHRGAREPTWQEEGASHAGAAASLPLTRPEPVANRNRGGFWQGWLGDWVGRSVGRSHWTIYMYPVGTGVQRLPFHRRQSKLELQRLAAASKHLTAAALDTAPKSELRQPAGTTRLLLLHLHRDACQRMEVQIQLT